MEQREYIEQLAKAWITSFAALVNTLKVANALDEKALLSRLNGYAELLSAKDAGAGQFLQALSASLSGDSEKAATILRTLH